MTKSYYYSFQDYIIAKKIVNIVIATIIIITTIILVNHLFKDYLLKFIDLKIAYQEIWTKSCQLKVIY